MTAGLLLAGCLLLGVTACATGRPEEGDARRFSGAYGGISGGAALGR